MVTMGMPASPLLGEQDRPCSSLSDSGVIEPGLVLLRGALPIELQLTLADAAVCWGQAEGEEGFYTVDDNTGERVLNAENSRGRIYDHISRFPEFVVNVCNDFVQQARQLDPAMPDMTCTHLLLNYYATTQGLQWHRDIYENDGTADHPIVNITIGSACLFAFMHTDGDPKREVVLESGDVLLFGGPCRYIKHAVTEVILDRLPESWPYPPGRFSFTFRDAPEAVGREEYFKYFKPSEHLVAQKDWEKQYLAGKVPPLLGAQESQSPSGRRTALKPNNPSEDIGNSKDCPEPYMYMQSALGS